MVGYAGRKDEEMIKDLQSADIHLSLWLEPPYETFTWDSRFLLRGYKLAFYFA